MKKLILTLMLLLLLVSCSSNNPNKYTIISTSQVDGYDIYELQHSKLFCRTDYEDIYYSGKIYNYGYTFKGCSQDMTFFIKNGSEFIYLQNAINEGYISLDDLIPQLDKLQRHPEEFSSKEADYYWLDFHINHSVVYAYAGGDCDQSDTEEFIIDGTTYEYSANGCLKDHILYMQVSGKYIPVSDLLADGTIDGEYLIPLLTEVTEN